VFARAQCRASVGRLARGNQQNFVQTQLIKSRMGQGKVGAVWRIEGTAKNPKASFSF